MSKSKNKFLSCLRSILLLEKNGSEESIVEKHFEEIIGEDLRRTLARRVKAKFVCDFSNSNGSSLERYEDQLFEDGEINNENRSRLVFFSASHINIYDHRMETSDENFTSLRSNNNRILESGVRRRTRFDQPYITGEQTAVEYIKKEYGVQHLECDAFYVASNSKEDQTAHHYNKRKRRTRFDSPFITGNHPSKTCFLRKKNSEKMENFH
ncbi:unnamed protein product [Oikopleura dioica]|uniref:Uncharacterized protein n=1 Tax=Oikopleura dioica TaxID=34765 RepID=E4YU14_OIKDI|nr:unnamed protein product [Oikopleura dioica]